MVTRIEALRKRREVLDSKLKELAAKEARKNAMLDKRRKIILGGWLMKHRADLVQRIVENGLERDQDRKAFADWDSGSAGGVCAGPKEGVASKGQDVSNG